MTNDRERPHSGAPLTERQLEIAGLIADDLTNGEIAARLGISLATTKHHVSEVLSRLELGRREDAGDWYQARYRRGAVRRLRAALPLTAILFGSTAIAALSVVLVAGALRGGVEISDPTPPPTPASEPTETGTAEPTATLAADETATTQPVAGQPPPHAPDGRTGIAELDAVIEAIVARDLAALRAFGSPSATDSCERDEALPFDQWAGLVTGAHRQLYAVFETDMDGSSARKSVIIGLDGETPGVRFTVTDGEIINVWFGCTNPLRSMAPSMAGSYDRYLVLPPRADLPFPPATHAGVQRTGESVVDAIIDLALDGDASGLVAALRYAEVACGESSDAAVRCAVGESAGDAVAVLPLLCNSSLAYHRPDRAASRFGSIAESDLSLHSVLRLPDWYTPTGEYLAIFVGEVRPYDWGAYGLVIADGAIVGRSGCGDGAPERLYPPDYIVPPLAGDAAPSAERRSGIASIDAALDAMAASDVAALAALIRTTPIGCVAEQTGIGSPPLCEEGQAEGTIMATLPSTGCEGHYAVVDDPVEQAERIVAAAGSLYAVTAIAAGFDGFWPGARYRAILDQGENRGVAVSFDDEGLRGVLWGCGATPPRRFAFPGVEPDFLLRPADAP